jgi:hypothetical protein
MLRTRILNLCRGISFHGKHLDLVLNVWPTFRKFNISHYFWMESIRDMISYMSIPYNKIFELVYLTLMFKLYFLKTLMLAIAFKL